MKSKTYMAELAEQFSENFNIERNIGWVLKRKDARDTESGTLQNTTWELTSIVGFNEVTKFRIDVPEDIADNNNNFIVNIFLESHKGNDCNSKEFWIETTLPCNIRRSTYSELLDEVKSLTDWFLKKTKPDEK